MSDVTCSLSGRTIAPNRIVAAATAILLLAVTTSGCSGFMQKKTGQIMGSYAEEHMVPYTMASGDLNMACETGVSMGVFLMSFERVTDPANKASLVTLLSAGMCAESEAWEAELSQLRAIHAGSATEAQDARIVSQRRHAVAASRFYAAYQQLVAAFGTPGEICPDLEEEDEIFYLLGLSAGMLSIVHDRAAEGAAEVAMDIPQRVARASACLDNDRWWGAPQALQASVWASVPGAAPEGSDPWAALAAAAEMGDGDGVRLARAFQVQLLDASGREEELKAAIAAHVASCDATPSNPDWQLLDRYATRMILHISDRVWTSERGHRTPSGALGTFWEPPVEMEGSDELFDDLFGSPEGDSQVLPPAATETEESVP